MKTLLATVLAVFVSAIPGAGALAADDLERLANADVCRRIVARVRPAYAELSERFALRRKWFLDDQTRQQKALEDVAWLKSMMDHVLGVGGQLAPTRELAELNQMMGERECNRTLLSECESVIEAAPSDTAVDRGSAGYRDAYRAYAARLAQDYRSLGDEHWEMAKQRKQSFEQSPYAFRQATEANRFMGYAEACRSLAGYIRGLQPPEPEPETVSQPEDIPPACRAIFRKNPMFCVFSPMGDADAYEVWLDAAGQCCKGVE